MVEFIFCEPNGVIGKIIRKLTGGRFSHVAVAIDGIVYEAVEFKGVIATNLNDWNEQRTFKIECELILVNDYLRFKQFLKSKVGGKYDYRGILSFLTFSQSQDENKWYCSELANEFFEVFFGETEKYLISPNAFYRKMKAFEMGLKR